MFDNGCVYPAVNGGCSSEGVVRSEIESPRDAVAKGAVVGKL